MAKPTAESKEKAARWVIDKAVGDAAKRGGNTERAQREAAEAIRSQQRKESEK